jgi:twitching motility protein PilT
MGLSFEKELSATIPAHATSGVELCEEIDQWFLKHPENREESFKLLRYLLLKMRTANASDLDLGAPGCNEYVWFRTYGYKKPIPELGKYNFVESSAIILSWLSNNQKKILYQNRSVDFSINIEENKVRHRFRTTVYFDNQFPAVNFRRINETIWPLDNLNIPKPILDRMDLRYEKVGLVLVTGITGSGKSTTLDAIIDMNNRSSQQHIVIIAHPIEYVHQSRLSIVRHREVAVDVNSFHEGAIQALRQDPDIIMVGEMRDPQTIAIVLEITDSGHKTFTTLHTSSAIDSIHRIVAEFPPEEQERIRNRLADVLTVIISQKLVPTVDNKLTLAKEILSVDSSVQAAIRNKNIGEIYQMMIEGRKMGMMTLEQDLHRLYKSGIITNRTAMNFANNKVRMMQLLSASA